MGKSVSRRLARAFVVAGIADACALAATMYFVSLAVDYGMGRLNFA